MFMTETGKPVGLLGREDVSYRYPLSAVEAAPTEGGRRGNPGLLRVLIR
jgi:hypothetical protein